MHKELQQKTDVLLRRLLRLIGKFYLSLKDDKRPSSYPYVTGDSFRALAQHKFDETGGMNPSEVKDRDIVFVGQSFVSKFFETIHPHINNRYVLIIHNGDDPMDEKALSHIDEKIIHCFAQDVTAQHEKVTPIPIGIENKHFFINGLTPFYNKFRKSLKVNPPHRKNKIFYSFSIGTNPTERTAALEYLDNHPQAEKSDYFLTPIRHALTLKQYKFVASPPGNSIESSRTWEAMYFGTVPIVKDYVAMKHFEKIGLPMWVIHDWKELDLFTEDRLAEKYDNLMKNANLNPLNMDYWIEQIEARKK